MFFFIFSMRLSQFHNMGCGFYMLTWLTRVDSIYYHLNIIKKMLSWKFFSQIMCFFPDCQGCLRLLKLIGSHWMESQHDLFFFFENTLAMPIFF